MATTSLVTIEDLFEIPDDEYQRDLIRGELLIMSPTGGRHGEVTSEIASVLRNFIKPRSLGRVYSNDAGFVLARNPDSMLGPDVAFVAADRLPPEDERFGLLALAPDLVVEVVSPSDRMSVVMAKVTTYLDAGVRMVVVVEPRRRTMTVYLPGGNASLLREDDMLDGGDVLPGFRVRVGDLFE